jgi:hypothetical protein
MRKNDFHSCKSHRDENLEKFREARKVLQYSPLEEFFTVIANRTSHVFTIKQSTIYTFWYQILFNETFWYIIVLRKSVLGPCSLSPRTGGENKAVVKLIRASLTNHYCFNRVNLGAIGHDKSSYVTHFEVRGWRKKKFKLRLIWPRKFEKFAHAHMQCAFLHNFFLIWVFIVGNHDASSISLPYNSEKFKL